MLERVTSPSVYALFIGGIQLKALRVLAGLNPAVEARDVVEVLNASMNYMVMQGIVNSTKVMWYALTNRASCRVALNYVALSIVRSPKSNSSVALRALSAVAEFQEALTTHRYGYARAVMSEVAENTSLLVAAYMACQLPPQAISEVAQPTSTEGYQVGNASVISAEDMLKAVAVLERLGPKAIEILSRVPMVAVVNAMSKVPLKALRTMSVDEIVKAIKAAATNSDVAFNPNAPTMPPSTAYTVPPGIGAGHGTGNATSGVTVWERPPIPRHWTRPQPGNPFQKAGRSGGPTAGHAMPSTNYVAVPVIGALVKVVKSVNLPAPPVLSASAGLWSLTLAKAENIETVAGVGRGGRVTGVAGFLPTPLLTLFLGFAVFAALTLSLRSRREPASVKPLPRALTSGLPAVVREFWEAVTAVSKASGVELRASLTHREITGELIRNLRADTGRVLLKLATLYEGVRYAGVKVTEELSLTAQRLLREVRALLEAS